ncbi:MAG: hypothetical protein HeimC3_12150 [Candidatus Heimdallarchaeota archaeon LC_3]|nr:MAG: hypothetical protein HeimC3_12150 [Candidatus Heimdallarchaeota archaeon LC_3]
MVFSLNLILISSIFTDFFLSSLSLFLFFLTAISLMIYLFLYYSNLTHFLIRIFCKLVNRLYKPNADVKQIPHHHPIYRYFLLYNHRPFQGLYYSFLSKIILVFALFLFTFTFLHGKIKLKANFISGSNLTNDPTDFIEINLNPFEDAFAFFVLLFCIVLISLIIFKIFRDIKNHIKILARFNVFYHIEADLLAFKKINIDKTELTEMELEIIKKLEIYKKKSFETVLQNYWDFQALMFNKYCNYMIELIIFTRGNEILKAESDLVENLRGLDNILIEIGFINFLHYNIREKENYFVIFSKALRKFEENNEMNSKKILDEFVNLRKFLNRVFSNDLIKIFFENEEYSFRLLERQEKNDKKFLKKLII